MPFVTPRAGTSSANNSAGRTTFRPPWVKEDAASASSATATKPTTTPWAKKTAAAAAAKENGDKSAPSAATATANSKAKAAPAVTTAKKTTTTPAETAKKVPEPVKKSSAPTTAAASKKNANAEPVNTKKAPEPVKKVAPTAVTKKPAATKKKEPTPPPESSSEEEESEEEEEETEEETESEEEETEEETESEAEDDDDDTTADEKVPEHVKKAAQLRPTTVNKKPEPESELKQRFTIEKPKLRSVAVVKRDKSMKKVPAEADDEEAEEGETEEERERRLRFKLEKPKLRHVKREEKPLPSKSTDDLAKIRPVLKKVPKIDELLKEPKEEPKPEFKTKTLRKAPSIKREQSIKNVPAPPPLPSLVPKAPPPPPPPLAPGEKRVLSSTQKENLDKLRTRPRRRPDWSEMMKEVESGKKLRHVACNDRSQPILTCKSITKVDEKFIYETEKDNSHNKLLQQIQGGIKLKPTRTNDRSKPVLDGLRKFRRQMTIEEQLQKSQSKVNMLCEAPSSHALGPNSASALGSGRSRASIASAMSIDEESPDELDDIDKIRDDLQSTKQMLALELRNREAQERENKKLLAKIRTLETELEREKSREKNLEYGSNVIVATMDPTPTAEQTYVNSLKSEVEDARKVSKEVEKNYQSTSELLVEAKTEIEEQRRQIQLLERKLAAALQGCATPSTNRTHTSKCFAYDDDDDDDDDYYDHYYAGKHAPHQGGGMLDGSRRSSDANFGRDSSPELDLEVSESDPDEPEEKKTERREKRVGKELKVLRSKLTKVKVKEEAAKKEKDVLKQAMKKNQVILKEENKKFKKLEKEVQKMAASMKLDEDDVDGEDKEDEEEAEEEHETEEEEESDDESEESESGESEAETGSESEPEDASNSAKKANVEPRLKKHESRFAAMKKCNVLLQANVDNLQDQIVQVRHRATNLQDELDAVIADLGF
ncbi:FK506-binding protein 5 isoform X1 [Drosophila pseudoobscura]|uniref:FK506-binding protein 5 isoform X1 n=2 Tax=Drosophila pseudoobscura pseudoobscura TaxID=46245 RepID=A0A6I8VQ15_DROPS|nr:FK506-binding protein 5 isoform X1 [Drosophila pseudoobscura]XP_015038107.2 FK506-binding protein 5 isoform X1 [Drosophila pseudoobscura]XP_033232959.1 FK506-binding protein 5 isoform X1 [Drosophila pseudoobscura]XP_033232960.1 FK506-binding protein 5 isoform X1 [Drosophila pseudoobscura]XP_033232961.1 FK506-binding protein 5 isoform X1 [Drosophila pseudoobscura]XP_033232962.1 FK506-binding protein 5 isoform X1 [Drosophila pseudoobscura]XP_033232963.1 FK506-binding protein 5 isoform X1 [Dr